MILDASRSADDNFNSLLCITKISLDEALELFVVLSTANSAEERLEQLKYDYDSLFTTVVGELLHMLSFIYAEDMTQKNMIETMPCVDSREASEYETNRMRVRRIIDSYINRNDEHAEYLNSPAFEPKANASEALWYNLLSEFPILKRFLHNKEPIITKKFFDDLNSAYDKIDEYGGYERFFLMHKLERMSKLEMFYKVLALIKKEKQRLKLPDSSVQIMLHRMDMLHRISGNKLGHQILDEEIGLPRVYHELLAETPFTTINSIVFNTDSLIDLFISEPRAVYDKLEVLNFICNAVVYNVCYRVEEELSKKRSMEVYELIKDAQDCYTATNFFDEYVDSHNLHNRSKNCSEDITFTHFKTVYVLKKENQRRESKDNQGQSEKS